MAKTILLPLHISGSPWSRQTLSYNIGMSHGEARRFEQFLREPEGDIEIRATGRTRLIGWPTVGVDGEELTCLTVERDGKPVMACALDCQERASVIQALKKPSSRPWRAL